MIFFNDLQDKKKYDIEILKKLDDLSSEICKNEGVKTEYEISLTFVDNEKIRTINNEYRSIYKSTDVLSFPILSYREKVTYKNEYNNKKHNVWDFNENRLLLGDVIISLEKAFEQSKDYNHSFEREITYLFTHSVLHLLGYDHIDHDDKKIMREQEEKYLKKFNIGRDGMGE